MEPTYMDDNFPQNENINHPWLYPILNFFKIFHIVEQSFFSESDIKDPDKIQKFL